MVTLGIDFGTSSTVAIVGLDDGRAVPLLFGETPLLPSAVCITEGGELLVGRDAVRASRSRPEAFEPHPKSRIDDGEVLLGERAVPVVELIGAVLRRVHQEAVRVAGAPIDRLVLAHPAAWGARRRQTLQEATAVAGLPSPALVAEPVAAAAYFVRVLGHEVPPGGCLVVYDFGAGTFDASVVRRAADTFEVLAEEGILNTGGVDVDAAIVAYLGATHGAGNQEGWRRLTAPVASADRRMSRIFWEDVRTGKEELSRASLTTIFMPILEQDAVIGREQLEHLARPLLDRTVAATRVAVRNAGIRPEEIAALFLVGGSSRMSLSATLLHRSLGIAPTVIEQPELIVAGGTLHVPLTTEPSSPSKEQESVPPDNPTPAAAERTAEPGPDGMAGHGGHEPVRSATETQVVEAVAPASPARGQRRLLALVGSALAVIVIPVVALLALQPWRSHEDPASHAGSSNSVRAGSSDNLPVAGECPSGTLAAQGSAAQQHAMAEWIRTYEQRCSQAEIYYEPTGSSAGVAAFQGGAADFAGSDSALKDGDEATKANVRCGGAPALNLPMLTSPIAIAYHIDGVRDLQLKPETLAKIFSGAVTTWDAPEIKADNPSASLPSTPILAVHRSDSAGTTETFTGYLASVAGSAWTAGKDKVWKAQGGQAERGSDGIATALKMSSGSIGYVEWPFATTGSLNIAKIYNGSGKYAALTAAAAGKAVAGAKVTGTGDDLKLAIDYKTTEAEVYPIVLVTYEIVCSKGTTAGKLALLKGFLSYTVSAVGQGALEQMGYAPLPEAVRAKVVASIDSLG